MKKLIIGLVLGTVLFGAASTAVAEIEVNGDVYAGIYSKYLFRGFDLLPDDNISFQTGTDISFNGFTVSWWGAFDQKNNNLYEADFTIDYTHDFADLLSVSIGNILYDVDDIRTTNEIYLSTTLNTLLNPSFAFYYDYDELKIYYTTLGISHDLALGEKLSLGLGAQASYLGDDPKGLGTTKSWFHNLELTTDLAFALTDQISIDASLLYSGPLTDDARNIAGIREEYVGGLSATLAF